MNDYVNMLLEYKQSEAALRQRIGELKEKLSRNNPNIEQEDLQRRKMLLEQELYELLDVINIIYEYAGCGVDELCRNA